MGLTLFYGIFYYSSWMWWIFHTILSVPQNTFMNLNNVMAAHTKCYVKQ